MRFSNASSRWLALFQAKRYALHAHCSFARLSEAKPNRRSGNAVLCHAFTAEPVAKQGASIMRASRIKQRAHWLACGGAALFFIHLRITWLEVNGAGAAVQLAPPV